MTDPVLASPDGTEVEKAPGLADVIDLVGRFLVASVSRPDMIEKRRAIKAAHRDLREALDDMAETFEAEPDNIQALMAADEKVKIAGATWNALCLSYVPAAVASGSS